MWVKQCHKHQFRNSFNIIYGDDWGISCMALFYTHETTIKDAELPLNEWFRHDRPVEVKWGALFPSSANWKMG
jgi:hypothetical protein